MNTLNAVLPTKDRGKALRVKGQLSPHSFLSPLPQNEGSIKDGALGIGLGLTIPQGLGTGIDIGDDFEDIEDDCDGGDSDETDLTKSH